jgi:hypothetical protein
VVRTQRLRPWSRAEFRDTLGDLRDRKTEVGVISCDGGARHPGCRSLVRVLDESQAAAVLDCTKPHSPVTAAAREDNADDALSVSRGRRDEERVGCRTRVVNLRPSIQSDTARFEHHVMVWRCHIDVVWLDRCVVVRMCHMLSHRAGSAAASYDYFQRARQ